MALVAKNRYPPCMLHLLRAGLAALSVLAGLGAAPAAAQLVIITAEGSLEHLHNPASAPSIFPATFSVSLSLRLDQPPIASVDPHVAIYLPLLAQCRIGADIFAVEAAEFAVERYPGAPFGPSSGYLMRGRMANGWLFSAHVSSSSTDYAPDFELPRVLPVGDLDRAHDLTITEATGGWAAYGDGTITSVRFAPVPEPATLGLAAVGMLVLVAAFRARRARNPAIANVAGK